MKKIIALCIIALAGPALATVPNEVRTASYTCSSGPTFSYPFKITSATHLSVSTYLLGSLYGSLTYPSDFSVTGVGLAAGGTIALTSSGIAKCSSSSGKTIKLERVVPLTQGVSFRSQGVFSPGTHEDSFDRGMMAVQQVRDAQADALSAASTAQIDAQHAAEYATSAWRAVASAATPGTGTLFTADGGSYSRTAGAHLGDWVNVLSFIPSQYHATIKAGTELTDLTTYIQAAIDYAVHGTVIVPPGTYRHHGLLISNSTSLVGMGWSFGTGGSQLLNTSLTADSITIRGAAGVIPPGSRIFNLYVQGGRSERPTATGNGIVVDSEGDILIDQVYVAWAGGSGIKLNGGTFHTTVTTIRHSRVEKCGLDGVFGLGSWAHQINAINLETSEIIGNLRHGVNVWPIGGLNLERNTIQGNIGIGIVIDASADGLGTANASGNVVNIVGNYLENNYGGAFYARAENAGGRIRAMGDIHVERNLFSLFSPTAGVTALAKFACDTSGGFRGTYWGRNSYFEDDGLAYVDFGNCHEYTSVLDHAYFDPVGPFTTKFQNTYGMTIKGLETEFTRYSGTGRTGNVTLLAHQIPMVQHWDADLGSDVTVTLSTANDTTVHGDKFKIIRNGFGPGKMDIGPGIYTIPGYQRGWADFMFDGTAWRLIATGDVPGASATIGWDPGEVPTSGYVTTLMTVPGARPEMHCDVTDTWGYGGGVHLAAHSDGADRVLTTIHNQRANSFVHSPAAFLVKCH